MTDEPEISVVMGVHNGGAELRETIDSVLSQEGVSLEFIVVNDGSTDGSREMLEEYAARDARIRVLHQENQGLTRALIVGCAIARGRYIARQDAGGDVSMPGRFAKQRDFLDAHPDAVLNSCGTQFLGPEGELLFEVSQRGEELQRNLQKTVLSEIRGPSSHPSVMMRRDAYEKTGGYRAPFRVAQDLDLWVRMAEIGPCHAMPEVLYKTIIALGSVSAKRRKEQVAAAAAILACAGARRRGESDAEILHEWEHRQFPKHRGGDPRSEAREAARFYYFLASVLRKRHPQQSWRYYTKSIRSAVLFLPAWAGIIRLIFR